MNKVVPVVLCGGSGTRLWPLSRAGFPKQFLMLSGNASMFQQAVVRINQLASQDISIGKTLVVMNEEHRFIALEQMRELNGIEATLLLEPVARNTAPALTLAALQAMEYGSDPILVVTPADQVIVDNDKFCMALSKAVQVAANGTFVVLGVLADKPETGYGYIKSDSNIGDWGEYRVKKFTEKPNLELAKEYVKSNQFTWNSGIFVMRASAWLQGIKKLRPDILSATEIAWKEKASEAAFVRPNKDAFMKIPSESIDYAVMERAPGFIPLDMLPLNAGWNDLGAWDAVWRVKHEQVHNANGNVSHGDAILIDTHNSLVHASSRLVGVVGVSDLVVIETPDAVLVINRHNSQDVKKLIQKLESEQRDELVMHRKVNRPWGWYDSVDEGPQFKVKRIQVNPGASLSLQMHRYRAEHWVVVKGTAQVTCGNKVALVLENQSVYIAIGQTHRLHNPGNVALEIIEVQTGSYLGEDDIVRFEDSYGR